MEQIIHKSLAGRRFALMGFERPEEESIIAALATARGIGHVVGGMHHHIPGLQGLNHFARFDASIINASANHVPEQPAPIEILAGSRKPAIIVGSFSDLIKQYHGIADINREFVLRPYTPDDLILRAFRILRFVESTQAIEASMHNGGPPRGGRRRRRRHYRSDLDNPEALQLCL